MLCFRTENIHIHTYLDSWHFGEGGRVKTSLFEIDSDTIFPDQPTLYGMKASGA